MRCHVRDHVPSQNSEEWNSRYIIGKSERHNVPAAVPSGGGGVGMWELRMAVCM